MKRYGGGGTKMAKRKVTSLKKIGREIGKAQNQLRKARRRTTPEGMRQLNLQIERLETIKSEVVKLCRSWFLSAPVPTRSKG
jgi:hypothetical protein